MSRRSTVRRKDDAGLPEDDHASPRKTRRQSITGASPSAIIKTPVSKSYKKKLNLNEIAEDLEASDSNDESKQPPNTKKSIGKDENNIYKSNLILDENTICIKLTKISNKEQCEILNYVIGLSEKKNEEIFNKNSLTKTLERPVRSRKSNISSYNEKDLFNHVFEKNSSVETNSKTRARSATTRASKNSVKNYNEDNKQYNNNLRSTSLTSRKNDESLKAKGSKNIIQRKTRKTSETYQNNDEDSENEVDENETPNAINISPKRLRSKTPSRTPIKSTFATPVKRSAKHLNDLSNTPKKLPKTPSKHSISLNTPMKGLNLNDSATPKKHKTINNNTPKKLPKTPSKHSISLNTPMKGLNLNDSATSKKHKTINKSLQKMDSKLMGTPKRLSYQTSKDKTPEQINKDNRRKSIKRINYNENDNDSMYEDVDESDEFNVSAEEANESTSESEDISESDSSSSEIISLKHKSRYMKSTKKATSLNSVKDNLRTPSKTPKKKSMETPTKAFSRLSLKNSLTPSMHQRTANIVKPSTPLQEARAKLHVSVLPKSLPCREEQFNDIYTFLHARLSDSSGGCIYISGVPGTGKTATVNEVIRCLNKLIKTKELPEFKFVDVNGMKLSEPRQAYVQIWKQLTGQSTTWEEAHKLLQERFTKSHSKKEMTLLLVDELDLLCTKRQDVVYNLLDWPSKTGAKLVLVTIANTMDLPERVLMGKVTSRLGLTRLTFPPYNHKQLQEIVVSRLKGYCCNAFKSETIQLVARKVAAVSGDARRALDICRRATEVAEANDREVVSMIDVKQALDEMIASPKIQAIKHCSDMERAFLQAVCSEVDRTGVEEVVFYNVNKRLSSLCAINGQKPPHITEALSICARLGSWRLLLCDHSRMDIHQRLLLNVSTDDVHFAIQSIED